MAHNEALNQPLTPLIYDNSVAYRIAHSCRLHVSLTLVPLNHRVILVTTRQFDVRKLHKLEEQPFDHGNSSHQQSSAMNIIPTSFFGLH